MTSDHTQNQAEGRTEEQQLWYLDTSVAIRILLGDESAVNWWDTRVSAGDGFVASRLLHLEMTRVFRREGLKIQAVNEFVSQLTLLDVDNSLLTEAAGIEPHVKALDALHLASARRVGSITLATHDRTMIKVAGQLGLAALDPVEVR